MSNALIKEKLIALELRKQGMSYSQIRQKVSVSKSSLSLWLHRYPLSKERIKFLQGSEQRIERYRETMRLKKEKKLAKIYEKEKIYILPLTKKEMYIGGLCLYWGEGGKTEIGATIISNTRPQMIKFFINWLIKTFRIPKEKFWVKLHLYQDMNEEDETLFWSKQLGLKKSQFNKSYVKKTTLRGLTFKGLGHGTCNVGVYGVELKERIMTGIKVLEDYYSRIS